MIGFVSAFFARSPSAGPPRMAGRDDLASVARRVADVLRPAVEGADESRWVVRTLAQGRQASLFSVRAQEEGARVTGSDPQEELIVKVYLGHGHDDREAARDEFECLCRLHTRLDGTTHHGWTVRCPRPLHWCDRSAALVMTRVPGATLGWHLGQGTGPAPEVLDAIAKATVSSLRRYWADEPRLYGDLILNNVLCDLPTRTLALVDPGMPERFYLCEDAPLFWYPASRDLGFLLFWAASLVRPSVAQRVLHARQRRMVARVVRAYLDGLESDAQRRDALAEIETCARLHLARMPLSASPRGLWRRFVKRRAAQQLERAFASLRATKDGSAEQDEKC